MYRIYIRCILALVWLVVAIISGISGNMEMAVFYILMGGVFLYSACSAWKKGKGSKGGR